MARKLPALKDITKLRDKLKDAPYRITRITVLVEVEGDDGVAQAYIYKADADHELFVPTSMRRGIIETQNGFHATGELDMQFNIHRRRRQGK